MLGLFLILRGRASPPLRSIRWQGVTHAAAILACSILATFGIERLGYCFTMILILGFLFGVFAGSKLANAIPETSMRWGFVIFLLLVALRMITQKSGGKGKPGAMDRPTRQYWIPGLVIGFAGGMASGLLGIGGGIIMIPLVAWWLGFSQTEAQVTSLAVMLPPIGLPGVLVYAQAQEGLPWALMGGVGLGFAMGAYLGARGATRLKGAHLRRAFAGLVVLTAVLLAIKH